MSIRRILYGSVFCLLSLPALARAHCIPSFGRLRLPAEPAGEA